MLRVSKFTDYAVVVLSRLEAEGGVQTAPGLASGTGIAEPTVAKVLKMLAQSGLVEGLRGARGGYRLLRPLSSLPLSDVIVAIDGPIALTACVDGGFGLCEAENTCPVRGRWDPVNAAIRGALSAIMVSEIAAPGGPRVPMPASRVVETPVPALLAE
ncbi:Rrf2 family transcriptional regulator [Falsiroseomonas stagni]|uniref:Transcriptional regulator, BadM/Rrf2 family n=1 Tax=Falsiroseomonas stagni DSM 19981 TaxID=1123062 RepID=A0A1I4D8B8_9PROT|nr:Rrf2 family transcriptional regulator [Falsiroseomonas stagni]SFK90024.1 transcriptional regulator, BadM/Rrf2 family [Falsiroseomonas stagni DSM 19981]